MGRISNVFAFVGLILDVVGTSLGVIHAVLLQRRIQDNTLLLNTTTQILSRNGPDDSLHQSQHVRKFMEDMQAHFPSKSDTTGFENAFAVLSGLAIQPLDITKFATVKTRFSILGTLLTFGNTPLISMGLGVACLIISTILFAANSTSLLREVWISCVAVLVGIICLSLLPIRFV